MFILFLPFFFFLKIQKFDVQDVHEHFITCLEWSTNGMKLFSGDKKGQVVVTEIDFYQVRLFLFFIRFRSISFMSKTNIF